VLFLEGWLWDGAMITRFSTPVVIALLYQGLLSAALGFVVWNTMLKQYGASTLHSFLFIMPLSGVAAGALLLNEPVTHNIITASALVALGIAVVNVKSWVAVPVLPVNRNE
jgi:drug/metabolite transporter (DMT)-like permease